MKRSILQATIYGLMNEATDPGSAGASTRTPPAPKPTQREVLTVKMSDGREVEFVGKRKLLKDTIIEGSKVHVRFDFRNGNSIFWTVPDSILLKAAGHGIEQKGGDETAGEDDVDDMQLAVEAVLERLEKQGMDGWTMKKEGGGFGGASLLVKALMEVTGKAMQEVKDFLKKQVDAGTTYQKLNDAFSEDDAVGPVLKRLRKEKAGESKVDTKGLLGGLGATA